MEHLSNPDGYLGVGVHPLHLRLGCATRPVLDWSGELKDDVELYTCPLCFCIWAPDWPYEACTDEKCWCEAQADAWWHEERSLVFWRDVHSNESETLSGSEEETQKMPQVKLES